MEIKIKGREEFNETIVKDIAQGKFFGKRLRFTLASYGPYEIAKTPQLRAVQPQTRVQFRLFAAADLKGDEVSREYTVTRERSLRRALLCRVDSACQIHLGYDPKRSRRSLSALFSPACALCGLVIHASRACIFTHLFRETKLQLGVLRVSYRPQIFIIPSHRNISFCKIYQLRRSVSGSACIRFLKKKDTSYLI